MVGFGEVLSEDDAYAIHAFILERANVDKELRAQSDWWKDLKTWFFSLLANFIAWLM